MGSARILNTELMDLMIPCMTTFLALETTILKYDRLVSSRDWPVKFPACPH